MIYRGSKARIADSLRYIINQYRKLYQLQLFADLFCGGCNLVSEINGPRIANDINSDLIHLWKSLIDGWVPDTLYITKDEYYHIRNNPDKFSKEFYVFVGYFCSWSGLYWSGYSLKENRDFSKKRFNKVKTQLTRLKNVEFTSCSYEDYLLKNTIIYCDPPYQNTKGYRGIKFDHINFWNWCREQSKNNIVLVSEYTAPDDFICIFEKELSITMGKSNKKSIGKLFVLKGYEKSILMNKTFFDCCC